MTPEASVNMIKLHTVNGLAIAKEYDLPKEVQAAIMEHHGTMPLKFFYYKAKNTPTAICLTTATATTVPNRQVKFPQYL